MEPAIQADKTQTVATSSVIATPGGEIQFTDEPYKGFDLDDLIPKTLRQATEKLEAVEMDTPPAKPAPVTPNPGLDTPPGTDSRDSDDPEPAPDPDDILSQADRIAKALDPEPTEDAGQTEDVPAFWAESETYQELMSHLNYSGVPQNLLAKFAEEIAGHSTVDTTKLVGDLEHERASLKDNLEELQGEVLRLREVEREARFDNHPETDEQFIKPLRNAAGAIKEILDFEGSKVPLADILNSPNKTELLKVTRNMDLSDEDLQTVLTKWRTYKETQRDYEASRTQARASLKDRMELKVPQEQVTQIARKALINKMTTDERFKYVKTGIDEGLEKHENVAKVLGSMQHNFHQMINALVDPHSVINSPKEMQKLASKMLDDAHNSYHASLYPELKGQYDEKVDQIRVLSEAYNKLRRSAGGSTKSGSRSPTMAPQGGDGVSQDAEKDAETFKKFLKKGITIEELLTA